MRRAVIISVALVALVIAPTTSAVTVDEGTEIATPSIVVAPSVTPETGDGWAWGSEDGLHAFARPVADDGGGQGTSCRWHDYAGMFVWYYEYLPGLWTPHYPYERCA